MSLLLDLDCLVVLILERQVNAIQLEVQTPSGPVKGMIVTTPTGKIVEVFYGILYAQPPVGDLRFRRPLPVGPWNVAFDATIKPYVYPQGIGTVFGEFPVATMWNANTEWSEDCLKLNIWFPSSNRMDLPVMIWIYGNSFYSGSSILDICDAKILIGEEEIIGISINYMLGALGFLYFGREYAPGSMGLLDQMMAMQWVRDNIASFDGDPNKVTLFVESAGVASVSFLLLSTLSRGLFNSAILQSGSAIAPWPLAIDDKLKNHSYRLAEELRCGNRETHLNMVMNCLKQKNADSIIGVDFPYLNFLEFGFVPVVGNYFLTKTPIGTIGRRFQEMLSVGW